MNSHARRTASILGYLVVANLLGCATSARRPLQSHEIPDFARPKLMTGDEDVFTEDVISYRRLRRADFRASRPPQDVGAFAAQMGAVTCATIKSRPEATFNVVARGSELEVAVEGLVFEALMDRGCSWWNDSNETFSEAYVLEHEQIHLGLFEVEARRLTRRVSRERVSVAQDSDPDELANLFQRKVERQLEASSAAVLERSLRFDEDTSFQYRPRVQKRWLDAIERELVELAR